MTLCLPAGLARADSEEEAFRKELAELEKADEPRGFTFGLGVGGALNVVRYGQRAVRGKDSVIGGGGILSLVAGYFVSQRLALLVDTQLSLQRFDVGGESVDTMDGLIVGALRAHLESMHFLHGGFGITIGQRADVDSPGGQTTSVGLGFTAAGGYHLFRIGAWSLTAEVRFSGHVFPDTENSISILQWAIGFGVHRWE